MRWRATTAAVLAAVTALVAGCSSGDDPQEARERVVVFAGDKPVSPRWPEVSERCAELSAPLRSLAASADHFVDLSLDDAQRWLDVVVQLPSECGDDEAVAVKEAADAWADAVAPTYDVDEFAVLSAACADAVAPSRERLAGLDGRRDPDLEEVAAEAAQAAWDGKCTPAERALFVKMEVEPPQRRAGILAPSSSNPDQRRQSPRPAEVVAVPEARAELSEGCAAALGPARELLAAADGDEVSDSLRDALADAVADAVGACSEAELAEFAAVESAPALGLAAPQG